MSTPQIILLYVLTLPILPVLDLLWLGVLAREFYRGHLGHLLRPDVLWSGAIAFYLFYIAGVLFFAVLPALESGSLVRACMLGAALGFIAYMTYDLTNYATMKDWPLSVVIVDVLWGTFLTAFIAAVSFCIARVIA